ncbi:MAG: cell division ATP-binding protein FtsE [Bacilli bacterium]|nr:cell division ATP-binding protein FtsE [Bacilli bacterium]
MEFIKFKNVTKKYKNGVVALYNLNLSIEKGDFCFIIGGSGSGKSTLTKLLYREEKPTQGEIILGGLKVNKLRNANVYKLRRKLGIVFQDYRLLPKANVYENVAFALEVMGESKKNIRPRVLKAIELVGLKSKLRDYPEDLSGGEQQRVAIARAIVNEPKLLICDEPTGNLDPVMSMEIVELLAEINKKVGTTVIMVTHDKEIVNNMKKHVIALKDGHLYKDYKEGEYIDEVL